MREKKKQFIYIGDFDFRNENVQSFLVKNNGKILSELGYHLDFIGINTKNNIYNNSIVLEKKTIENFSYWELPNSLSFKGMFFFIKIINHIIKILNEILNYGPVSGVITYQCPTYAYAIKKIGLWCKKNKIPYIVNCADLPIFDQQPFHRKIIMKFNWMYMHRQNKLFANGIIAVSHYIQEFYSNNETPSIIIPPLFDSSALTFLKTKENNVPTFIYAGTPFKSYGKPVNPKGMKDRLDKVIDLFSLVSELGIEYRLEIIGISYDEYLLGVPRHNKFLEKTNSILFYGRLSHAETIQKVALSDFSINYRDDNMMTKAGFSTKIVESVSLGTPVIINDIGDYFDYLTDGESGFKLHSKMEDNVSLINRLCLMPASERYKLKKLLLIKNIFFYKNYKNLMRDFLYNINKKFND